MVGRFVNYVSPGSLPFVYPFLGGDRFVRGYYYGRYRTMASARMIQGEFRFPIVAHWLGLFWWMVKLPGANQFIASNFKYNVGGGLRILMDKSERTNLRLDYAVGQNVGNKGFTWPSANRFRGTVYLKMPISFKILHRVAVAFINYYNVNIVVAPNGLFLA